jgi:hypothetical protein
MTAISVLAPPWVEACPRKAVPTLASDRGRVVALRQRPVVAPGALAERAVLAGELLVSAQDLAGGSWWIDATAVWSDAAESDRPQRPRPIGLATGRSREQAVLLGLSDRLGWEGVVAFERGRQLPVVDGLHDGVSEGHVVLDGRLGHDVPTVVIIGPDLLRWGAGATWSAARHRALFDDDGSPAEVAEFVELLAAAGLGVAAVDMGSPVIRRVGVARYSVQLLVANDEPGRPWDAPAVE